MSAIIEPRVLKGFRDFLPDAEIERSRVMRVLADTFVSFGYVPIDTPILEYTEVLLGKGGGETDKQIFRFNDNGGRDVSMRFDLTVPFARYIAAHRNELYLPFKRFHIGKAFRGENTQRGRYREFVQCDFDCVGVDSASADFETVSVMVRSFENLGVDDATIHLAHRGLFNRFLANLHLDADHAEVLRTVDKIKKIGVEKTRAALADLVAADAADTIIAYVTPGRDAAATLEHCTKLAGGPADDTERLETVLEWAEKTGIARRIVLDPSITRGLDYYTGIVFETFLDALPGIGSVCSGGRYNDLASLYTKERLPGVGSSIGLDRLMAALEELGRSNENPQGLDVLVVFLDAALGALYHEIAAKLRSRGVKAEVYPEQRKITAQFQFAEKKGARAAIIVGADEAARNVVNVRDLVLRENHDALSIDAAVERVASITDSSSPRGPSGR